MGIWDPRELMTEALAAVPSAASRRRQVSSGRIRYNDRDFLDLSAQSLKIFRLESKRVGIRGVQK